MEIKKLSELKTRLLDDVKASVERFNKAVDGHDIYLEGLTYTVEYSGGHDGIPSSRTQNVEAKIEVIF